MRDFDAIILGAGIAGASVAFALKQKGLSVLVLEKDTICSGDSYAAGAFLSPKMSKPSPYKTYLNDAFHYSLGFYKEHFPFALEQCGLLKLPLDEADKKRLKSYEEFMTIEWEKKGEDYFFPKAGLIEPQSLIKAMLKDIDVIEDFTYHDITYVDKWKIDDFTAIHLIIATGSSELPFDLPYLNTKKVGGYRYDVRYHDMQTLEHNIHRELSFSHYHDHKVIIGATHIRGDVDLEDAAYHDNHTLLEKANTIQPLKNLNILKTYTGYRSATNDYFPIVGKVIHHDKTLEAYPYIKKGSKVPSEEFISFPNLYIHNALASRGFVFAPYNAMLLAELIVEGKEIDERLSPVRLFRKWARK
ncbi:MAG TPA: FAD-dependent oxidoreductase [Campylobacterales bacterium]|nr:FAD-dependent oxidoreductase [Campylobacterales bacterium]